MGSECQTKHIGCPQKVRYKYLKTHNIKCESMLLLFAKSLTLSGFLRSSETIAVAVGIGAAAGTVAKEQVDKLLTGKFLRV